MIRCCYDEDLVDTLKMKDFFVRNSLIRKIPLKSFDVDTLAFNDMVLKEKVNSDIIMAGLSCICIAYKEMGVDIGNCTS